MCVANFHKITVKCRSLKVLFFKVGLDRPMMQTYRNLLTKLPQGPAVLEAAYEAIEKKIAAVSYYIFKIFYQIKLRISQWSICVSCMNYLIGFEAFPFIRVYFTILF